MSLEGRAAFAARCDWAGGAARKRQNSDKVVHSTTLAAASTANTQLERHFDSDAVHNLKAASSKDPLVDGPMASLAELVAIGTGG